MRRVLPVCCVLLICPGMVAQSSSPASREELMDALLKRVEALEKRVQELEAQNKAFLPQNAPARRASEALDAHEHAAGAPSVAGGQPASHAPATTPPPAAAQQLPYPSPAVPAGETPAEEAFPSLRFRGFANVDFVASDSGSEDKGFRMGQFVLHLTSPIAKKVSVFGELSFTARPNQYAVEVERSIIRYDANDHFKISFGKYHTPVNYWNTAFHHGAWLQTTVSRPEMIQFGGRFLPVHFVGLLAEGAIPSGGAGLNYSFGVGNGRQTILLLSRDGDAGDVNSNRAIVANIFARPVRPYGLQAGFSVYRDLITPDTRSPSSFREWITSGHLVWLKESPEFIAELANVRHRDTVTGKIWNSQVTYAQVAYRLPWNRRRWKPYYRFEYIHVPKTEPVLAVPNLTGHTAGTRFDVTDYAAFKIEYRSSRRTLTGRFNGLFLQTAFTF